MWPHSEAWLLAPSIVASPMTIEPPTPVPSVRSTKLSSCLAAPIQCSPNPAAVASLANVTGSPLWCATRSRTLKPSKPGRLPARMMKPAFRSCGPGVPRPARGMSERATPASSATVRTLSPIRRQTSSGPRSTSVFSVWKATVRPSSSTRPTLMFVPPRSTPPQNGARAWASGSQLDRSFMVGSGTGEGSG